VIQIVRDKLPSVEPTPCKPVKWLDPWRVTFATRPGFVMWIEARK
jgi:hypothetical protein